MIEIYQPRYHDRAVLIANYKIASGYDVPIRIKFGSYKGDYIVPSKIISKAPIEAIKSKIGKMIPMRVVSLDDLERVKK